jgi:hypothetical protein
MQMTVQELINELEQVKNKDLEVFAFHDGELLSIGFIDDDLGDRVDINCSM